MALNLELNSIQAVQPRIFLTRASVSDTNYGGTALFRSVYQYCITAIYLSGMSTYTQLNLYALLSYTCYTEKS